MIEEDAREKKRQLKASLVEDLLESYPGDEARQNELRKPVRDAVEFVLEKVQRGGTIEVRVIPPSEEETEGEVVPGLGTVRDMQERGRAMSGVSSEEGLFLTRGTIALLRSVAEAEVEEEEEENAETGEEGGRAVVDDEAPPEERLPADEDVGDADGDEQGEGAGEGR